MAHGGAPRRFAFLATPNQLGTFFAYEDAQGTLVFVDALDEVPESERGSARPIDAASLPQSIVETPAATLTPARAIPRDLLASFDFASAAVGVGATLFVLFVLATLRGHGRFVLKGALLLTACVLLGGAYFGFARRTAGLGDGPLADPAALLRDARHAADAMQDKLTRQERTLDRAGGEP